MTDGVDNDIPVYTIGVVEEMTGLTGRRIRYYEQVGLINPARTKGNQRLYSRTDVSRLNKVKELLDQGLNLEGVKAMLSISEDTGQWPARTQTEIPENKPSMVEGPEPLNPRQNIHQFMRHTSGRHSQRLHKAFQEDRT